MSCKANHVERIIKKYTNGVPISQFNDHESLVSFLHDSVKEHRYLNLYIQMMMSTGPESFKKQQIISLSNKLYENRQILKNQGIDSLIENKFKERYNDKDNDNLELNEWINDLVDKAVLESRKNKFISNLLSSKDRSLLQKESDELISKIYDISGGDVYLQDFFRKIASMDSSKIIEGLRSIKSKLSNDFYKQIESTNAEIVAEDDVSIAVKVNDYDTMVSLGTPTWCIVRSIRAFYEYVEFPKQQYIVFSRDGDILFGATISSYEKFVSFDKADKPYPLSVEEIKRWKLRPLSDKELYKSIKKNSAYDEDVFIDRLVKWFRPSFFNEINEKFLSKKTIKLSSSKRYSAAPETEPLVNTLSALAVIAVKYNRLDALKKILKDNENEFKNPSSQSSIVYLMKKESLITAIEDSNPDKLSQVIKMFYIDSEFMEQSNLTQSYELASVTRSVNETIRSKDYKVARTLIKNGLTNVFNRVSFTTAINNRNHDFLRMALKNDKLKKMFDNNCESFIKSAAVSSSAEVMKLLLSLPETDPTVDNNYAVRYSYLMKNKETMGSLLRDERVIKSLQKSKEYNKYVRAYVSLP